MTERALHPTPGRADVLRAQLRAVGFALRLPAIAAAVLLALATVAVGTQIVRDGAVVDFHPERWILPGLAGLLLPIAVWNGEKRYGEGFLWTLPVDRRSHALVKTGAGWVWLMAGVGVFVLWLLAFTLVSGGNVLGEETLQTVPLAVFREGGLDPANLRPVAWRPEPLLWLAPFAAATAMYLLASALVLGTRHPLRWVVGVALAFFLTTAVAETANSRLMLQGLSRLISPLTGRHGLETLLVAQTESLKLETTFSTGEPAVVWVGLPDPGRWATAALLWTAAGLLALWAAASRHRERRRG